MSLVRLRGRIVAALGLVVLAGVFGGTAALAQKGGGGTPPPPAPGTIYFSGWVATSGNDGYYAAMSMNGDGSDKKQVPWGLHRTPSYQLHGGSRWFLAGDYDWDGPVDEEGIPLAYELFAVSQQGQWVQLTGDPNIHWTGDEMAVAWGKDDSFVSYGAWWFTGPEPSDVQGGLFVVDIDWSTGVPVAGPPTLLFEADASWYYDWQGGVNIYEHDWSPDGTAVVFRAEEEQGSVLSVADFSGGGAAVSPLAAGRGPVWSPDGGRIAFGNGEVWTIKPDGTNAVRLTRRTQTKTEARDQGSPGWSPDGAYIAYTERVVTKSKEGFSVMRIPAGGGGAVSLTSDLEKASGSRWRP